MDTRQSLCILDKVQKLIATAPYGYASQLADIWIPAHDGKVTVEELIDCAHDLARNARAQHPGFADKLLKATKGK